jgi:protein-disulfide isomerase
MSRFLPSAALVVVVAQVYLFAEQRKSDTLPDRKDRCCELEPLPPGLVPAKGIAVQDVEARHVEGTPSSAIRVVVYEDLQCPDCAALRKILDEVLLPKYGKDIAFEFRDFPLPHHSWAKQAAIAAGYLQSVNPALATDFRRSVQASISSVTANGIRKTLTDFCRERGIESTKALASLEDSSRLAVVDREFDRAVAAGIRRTPTIIAGGTRFVERISLVELQQVLDDLIRTTSGKERIEEGEIK